MPPSGDTETKLAYHLAEWEMTLDPARAGHVLPDPGDARSILDIGCGAGQTMMAIGGAKRCVGVDVDLAALRFGRSRLQEQVGLLAARGEVLPFADNSFDLVYSRVALPYMNIPVALAEMHRVLRPGGRVWLTLHNISIPLGQFRRGNLKGKIFATYIVVNGLYFHLSGRTFPIGGERRESFQTKRGIRTALRRAGFGEPEFHVTDRYFVVTATYA